MERRVPRKSLPTRVVEVIVIFLMIVLIALVAAQVFMRYVMSSPLIWSEELARMVFIYLTYLGAGLAFQRHENLRLNILTDAIPTNARLWLRLAMYIIEIAFMGIVLYYSVPLLQRLLPAPTPALYWSMATFYAGVFVGGLAIFVYAIVGLKDTISDIRNLRSSRRAEKICL